MKMLQAFAVVVVVGAASTSAVLAGQTAQERQTQTRFRGMDTDKDGVITRTEWRGSTQAFRQQDTNRDGVLSGTEIRGVTPQPTPGADEESRRQQNAATAARILSMDADKDGVITRAEWRDDIGAFRRQDTNNDGVLSGEEVRVVAFQDADGDGVITRAEWQGDAQAFREHDRNRDGVLSGSEARALLEPAATTNDEARRRDAITRFNNADRNRDGRIARDEWTGNGRAFSRMDTNGDNLVTRTEFATAEAERTAPTSGERRPTAAYQSGYDRGMAEGRTEGKGDRGASISGRWDLENQGELERADSGYDPRVGSREDYQAGYRAGFRLGYKEGFGPRNAESAAYKAGHDRGMTEGRKAGRDDRNVNGARWDLEGQRELEQADSGYDARFGPRDEYQAGYRTGFRLGYKEGFGPR
jgi:Ca2+-binding EF-hand superfamily protein